jgi:PAS domain S-box-containing protein
MKESNKIIKQLEEKIQSLEQENKRLREFQQEVCAILEPLDSLLFIIDKEGNYLHVSPTCPDHLLIMSRKELQGKNVKEIFTEGRAKFFMNSVTTALEEKRTVTTEYSLPIDGKNIWFESRCTPIFESPDKEPTKVFSLNRDITEWRKQ